MNDQFIQGVLFDWNKIDDDSYLKKIEAFHGIENLAFKNPITFFCRGKWKWKINITGSNCCGARIQSGRRYKKLCIFYA